MKLLNLVAGLTGTASAAAVLDPTPAKIPSRYESAVQGRRILALSKLADLATVFPDPGDSDADTAENRPEGLGGVPVSLMDYVADCEDQGNPTLLAIKIATSFKNVEAGSNMTISVRWIPPYPPAKRIGLLSRISSLLSFSGEQREGSEELALGPDPIPYSAANLPRFSLFGYLEPIEPDAVTSLKLAKCFTDKHHEAKWWLPGNAIHESSWARLVVTNVYWVGGFGNRAYIGWIPAEEWSSVTEQEWQQIRLPGERKGWSEWAVESTVVEL
ncbi:hypothetical protein GMORB2_5231 [Geosmithia morbida]|uniref:CREG-like beta-barrel domain-containing protein n=1 Tax=Geosmithia morbida TaxID=1094350 RepID=A0A9P5D6A9_9HYPO|nr:uncharacterized protein GMORB2_5231 [Geosmithia morbida]KAF4124565.1 hypothetical protein GMORB2_5231 [Geosmithia morbida]